MANYRGCQYGELMKLNGELWNLLKWRIETIKIANYRSYQYGESSQLSVMRHVEDVNVADCGSCQYGELQKL